MRTGARETRRRRTSPVLQIEPGAIARDADVRNVSQRRIL
jgi:hypothetical protein